MSAAAVTSLVNIAGSAIPRNQGLPLDIGWVNEVRVNLSAVERRVLRWHPSQRRGATT